VSEIDHGARARLDHIEQQLQALFPGQYVSFAAATAAGIPPGVIELVRAGKTIAAIQEYRTPPVPVWRKRKRPSTPSGSRGPGRYSK